jgi:hypothetical protein
MKRLLLLLILPIYSFGQGGTINQPLLTPVGSVISFSPNITIANSSTTEISLLGSVKDTIRAKTLVPYRPYRFEMACVVNTPAVSLPTLALKVKLGSTTVAMVSATSVLGGLTNAGIRIRGIILSTGTNTQLMLTEIIQPNGGVLTIGNGNANFYTSTTIDMTSAQALDITATWGGFTLGTANIKSVWYYRPDY